HQKWVFSMKATGRGNRNENTHISDSYDDAFTATSKEQFAVCDTSFVTFGVDTPECTMIPQSAVGTDVHSNLPSVNGRPHVREENQRNYIAQRRQPSHSLCNQVCRYCGAKFWFDENSGDPMLLRDLDTTNVGNNTTSPYIVHQQQLAVLAHQ
ncbi:hypothetical protein Tco_1020852, partial [Tanacetum coccineum]